MDLKSVFTILPADTIKQSNCIQIVVFMTISV